MIVIKKIKEKLENNEFVPFEDKEKYALELIKKALKENDNPFISCSFGKDSLVTVHLVHQIDNTIPVIWSNTGVAHRSVYQLIKHYRDKWNIIEVKPKTTFKKIVEEYGFPIGARSTGSNVAVSECCKQLKKKPMEIATEDYNLEFNGMTAYESWTRYTQIKGYGDYKFVKSRGKSGRQVCLPIAWWHVEDIWEYIDKYSIKYPKVYDQEVEGFTKLGEKEKCKGVDMDRNCIRVGCWCCPLPIKYTNGIMKQLREYYPEQWKYLMDDMGLAEEIADLKLGGQGDLFKGYFDENTKKAWLEQRPCFFDKI